MKDKIEAGLLNDFVEQLDAALRSFLDDPSNIDISDEDTDVQEVLSADLDVIDGVEKIENIDQEDDNFSANAVVTAYVTVSDSFGDSEIEDTIPLKFSIELTGKLDEQGNIESLDVSFIEQE